jgi:hypothetical protein
VRIRRMNGLAAGFALLLALPASAADGPAILQGTLPGKQKLLIVVTEGRLEPRSIGSYAVRVYGPPANPRAKYDGFIAGIVRRRDGAVSKLVFSDVDGDARPDIVVIVRSAGTGGYVSADAFRVRGKIISLVGSVKGLAPDADPVAALKQKRPAKR